MGRASWQMLWAAPAAREARGTTREEGTLGTRGARCGTGRSLIGWRDIGGTCVGIAERRDDRCPRVWTTAVRTMAHEIVVSVLPGSSASREHRSEPKSMELAGCPDPSEPAIPEQLKFRFASSRSSAGSQPQTWCPPRSERTRARTPSPGLTLPLQLRRRGRGWPTVGRGGW